MASGRIVDYLGHGDAVDKPVSLTLTTGAIGVWYSDDTGDIEIWNGSGWNVIGGGGSGAVDSVNGRVGAVVVLAPIGIAVGDETSDLTTGAGKVGFRVPYAMTLTEVRASVRNAPTGDDLIVDINKNGATILSAKLQIDDGDTTSTTSSAPAVISDDSLADDDEITIDIDQIGSSNAGAGLKVWLIGYAP